MRTAFKLAAVAGVVVLTAGSAAWSQTYTTTPGTQGSYSGNQGSYNPSYSGTQGTYNQGSSQGWNSSANQGTSSNQGNWGSNANQGSWNSGMQGTSTPYGGQAYSQSGYGAGNITTYQEAEQELGKYGYNSVRDLRAMQGWSADAMKNGQKVHVILGDNGLVATFPGR